VDNFFKVAAKKTFLAYFLGTRYILALHVLLTVHCPSADEKVLGRLGEQVQLTDMMGAILLFHYTLKTHLFR